MQFNYDAVIIGGGPAGMIAAIEAARRGLTVVILERNEKLGKKLYITGKGRCNLTNAGDRQHLIANTVRNGRFLYSSFTSFGSKELMEYVEGLGVSLVTRRGNRVFPASGKSSDIIRAFHKGLTVQLPCLIELGQRVAEIVCASGAVAAVKTVFQGECITAILLYWRQEAYHIVQPAPPVTATNWPLR